MGNTSRFGAYLCLVGAVLGVATALVLGGPPAVCVVLTAMTFLLGLTVLHAGLRQDQGAREP